MTSKETLLCQLQIQVDQWRDEIDMLEKTATKVDPSIRAKLDKRMVELQQACNQVRAKINDIHQEQDSSWESLREGASQMWTGFRDLMEETKTAFQEGCREAESRSPHQRD